MVDEGANSIDRRNHYIPTLKVNRWILDKANAFGRSTQDDTTGFESGGLREEGNGLADVENLLAEDGKHAFR